MKMLERPFKNKYIAEARIVDLHKTVTNANFFSIVMDESIEVEKIDD